MNDETLTRICNRIAAEAIRAWLDADEYEKIRQIIKEEWEQCEALTTKTRSNTPASRRSHKSSPT